MKKNSQNNEFNTYFVRGDIWKHRERTWVRVLRRVLPESFFRSFIRKFCGDHHWPWWSSELSWLIVVGHFDSAMLVDMSVHRRLM